jgi:hypothetical protein
MSRFVLSTLVAVMALSLVPVTAGAADDVQAQLNAMKQQMNQMQQQLQATKDQLHQANQKIEGQQDLIQRSAIDKESSSGLSSFLDTIEVDGFLSAGWMYRFPNPDNGTLARANLGSGGFVDPLHPDANTFSLDAAWIGIGRPTSDENRAGFRLDMVMGKTAQLLDTIGYGTFPGQTSGSFLQFYLQQAYIEYLAPVGDKGIKFQAGKMETWIGAEVAESPKDFNITRGLVWTIMQPITNVGIRAETDFGNGFDAGVGFVNGTRANTDTDVNSDKAVVGKIAYNADTWGAQFSGTYGSSQDQWGTNLPSSKKETILDLILRWNPTDKFSSYIDGTWMDSQNNTATPTGGLCGGPPNFNSVGGCAFGVSDDMRGWGVSAAGRYAITDRAGLALRAEWVDIQRQALQNLRMYGITSTLDYKLTNHLTVRAEARYDNGAGMNLDVGGAQFFPDAFSSGNGNFNRDYQVTSGVEVLYTF